MSGVAARWSRAVPSRSAHPGELDRIELDTGNGQERPAPRAVVRHRGSIACTPCVDRTAADSTDAKPWNGQSWQRISVPVTSKPSFS